MLCIVPIMVQEQAAVDAPSNGTSHANGKHYAPSGSMKQGHAFNLSSDWSDRVIVDDQVYSKRRLDCSEGEVLAAPVPLQHQHSDP